MILWKTEDNLAVYLFEVNTEQMEGLKNCMLLIQDEFVEEVKEEKKESAAYIPVESFLLSYKYKVTVENTRYKGIVFQIHY